MEKLIEGTKVPVPGFGTFTLTAEKCNEAVADAIAIGYRHFDTAQEYQNENEVGAAIKNSGVSREELFLTTKVWYAGLSYDQVIETTESSLKKLQTDYVDLLLIHWPSPENIPLKETLNAMYALKEEGKVKHIGVSNFTPSLLQKALEIGPVFCNQVEYHPLLNQDRLVKMAQEHGLMLTAYSPLAHGKVADNELLKEIAKKHGKTPAQVSLRWLVQQDNVVPIPRSSSHQHRKENFEIFDFELDQSDMDSIFELSRQKMLRLINPSFAPEWENEYAKTM